MKKSTLIRSDKPHSVKMTEGSNIAQRKNAAKKPEKVDETPAPENIQKTAAVKVSKPRRVSTPTPQSKPARRKAPPPSSPAPAKDPAKKATTAKPRARPSTVKSKPTPPAEVPLWEQDNPVKARIEQLRVLNAQLSEQLQRLPTSRPARGLKS